MRPSLMGTVAGSAIMIAIAVALPLRAQSTNQDKGPTTVVVNAKPPSVVHKIDRSVYDLKDNPQATTGSVSDVLNTLPSVNVDTNGNVSVRGTSVQIMVDGKPSAALKGANLASALQAMPANTVARIEVVTNPGAEFHSDAATVINIITKKSGTKAPTGGIIINAGNGDRGNLTLSGAAGGGKWSFNGSLSQREDLRLNRIAVDRVTSIPATHMVETSQFDVRVHVTALDGTASYAFSDTDTLSVNGNVTLRNRPRRDIDHIAFLDTAGRVIGDSTTFARGRQSFNVQSLNSTWKHTGPRDGETLTLQARHQDNENLRDYRYNEVFAVPLSADNLYRRLRTEREIVDDLNGDYILPLGKDIQFKTGFDIQYDRDQNYNLSTTTPATGGETVIPSLTNRYLIDQTLSAAYVDYQHPLGKWVIDGGLRVENMQTRLRQAREATAITTSDVQWSPSLYLSRDLTTKSKLKLSYSHRIDRPATEQLNPLEAPLDAQDVQIGNPYLRPGQTESFEVGYDYTTSPVNFSGTLYGRQLRDTIIQTTYYRNPGDTVLVTSYTNAGHGTMAGLDMSLELHPSAKLRYNMSSDIYHISQTVDVDGAALKQSLTTHHTKASVTLTPSAQDSLQIVAILNGKALVAAGTMTGFNLVNLTYTHKISPRLKMIVTGSDVLNTTHIDELIRTSQYRDHTLIKIPGQTVYIGIDYKLGAVRGG